MPKALILGDLHIGVRNGNPIFRTMMGKYFDYLIKYIEDNNIDYVFQLGDMLDNRKKIDFLSSELLLSFLGKISKTKVQFHTLLGNHDVYFKDSNDLSGIDQYISVIRSVADTSNLVLHTDLDLGKPICLDGFNFYFFPWVNSTNADKVQDVLQNVTTVNNIALGHFEFAGFEVIKGIIMDHGTLDSGAFSKWFKVYSGHYHIGSKKGNVHYIGTPYMLTWADYGTSPKGFVVFDTENGLDEFVPTPEEFTLFRKKSVVELSEEDVSKYAGTYLKVEVPADFEDTNRTFDKLITKLESVDLANYQVDDYRETDLTIDTEINYNSAVDGDSSDIISSMLGIVENLHPSDAETYKSILMTIYEDVKNNDSIS